MFYKQILCQTCARAYVWQRCIYSKYLFIVFIACGLLLNTVFYHQGTFTTDFNVDEVLFISFLRIHPICVLSLSDQICLGPFKVSWVKVNFCRSIQQIAKGWLLYKVQWADTPRQSRPWNMSHLIVIRGNHSRPAHIWWSGD